MTDYVFSENYLQVSGPEGVRRNALRAMCPKSSTLRDKHEHRTKEGDLWEISGLFVAFYKRASIIMLQKSSARKGFCAEGL